MNQVAYARDLRQRMTDAERFLWSKLRRDVLGHTFRRQVPLGPYIVDFACLARKLVIEVDGGQHCGSDRDKVRDQSLRDHGYRVLRFWNHEVLNNIEGVLVRILEELQSWDPPAQKEPPS